MEGKKGRRMKELKRGELRKEVTRKIRISRGKGENYEGKVEKMKNL